MIRPRHQVAQPPRYGLGTVTAAQYGAGAAGAAGTALQFANAHGGDQYIAATGSALLTAAPFTGPAAPFVAAAGAIALLLGHFGVGRGCGQTCVLTAGWANEAEAILRGNILAYFALPAPRRAIDQAAALANFDAVWSYLHDACSKPELGEPGRRCIADRQAGACTWRQTADSPLLSVPGEPQPGSCWNWFSGYRDPIAHDAAAAAPAGDFLRTLGLNLSPAETVAVETYWLPAALLVGLLVIL
jgi:hypothetical protein